ncbi:MAG: hypothetical protein AABW58_03085 [Nanoarchaeota archaeon]
MNTNIYAKLIGITLLNIGLFISAFKNNVTLSISIIVIGIGFVLLMNNLD